MSHVWENFAVPINGTRLMTQVCDKIVIPRSQCHPKFIPSM